MLYVFESVLQLGGVTSYRNGFTNLGPTLPMASLYRNPTVCLARQQPAPGHRPGSGPDRVCTAKDFKGEVWLAKKVQAMLCNKSNGAMCWQQ